MIDWLVHSVVLFIFLMMAKLSLQSEEFSFIPDDSNTTPPELSCWSLLQEHNIDNIKTYTTNYCYRSTSSYQLLLSVVRNFTAYWVKKQYFICYLFNSFIWNSSEAQENIWFIINSKDIVNLYLSILLHLWLDKPTMFMAAALNLLVKNMVIWDFQHTKNLNFWIMLSLCHLVSVFG